MNLLVVCLMSLSTSGVKDQIFPPFSDEAFDRDWVEWFQRSQSVLEKMIKWIEQKEQTPEMQQRLQRYRGEFEKGKLWEKELKHWQQQRKLGLRFEPEAIERLERRFNELWGPLPVAPMPREKQLPD